MTVADLESTAFHEAAHYCVSALYFGHKVTELSVNRDKGSCRFRVPKGDVGLFQEMAVSMAGKITEDRLRGFKGERETSDYRRAFDCALSLSACDNVCAQLLLQWAERRTGLLVEKLWPKICAVAQKLLDSLDNNSVACLTGEQIQERMKAA